MNIFSRITPTQWLYILAILGSIALSWWLNLNALINNDGILYLKTAQAYTTGGLEAASAVYKWPFYSILIALIEQFSQLSLEQSAFLLNTFLCVLVVTGFIAVVSALGGTLQVQVCAAIIILLHTGLNDYREYIIRDFGHWAFMLYALYSLIIYAKNRELRYALAFGLATIIAFLFRTEAIFLLLAPVILLLPITPWNLGLRVVHTLGAYIIIVPLLALGVFSYELLAANPWLQSSESIDLIAMQQQKITEFRQIIPELVHDNEVIYFVLGGMLSYFFIRLLLMLSLPYGFLVGYVWYKHLLTRTASLYLVFTFIIIYLAIVLGFLSYQFFLTGRYVMPLALLLSLFAPFGLSAIFDAWKSRKAWLFPIVVLLLLYLLGDSIISTGPSKIYIKDAGIWLEDHLPENVTAYSNNRQIAYYGSHTTYGTNEKLLQLLTGHDWQAFDYLIIASKDEDTQLRDRLQTLKLEPMQVFSNARGDRVDIYKTK